MNFARILVGFAVLAAPSFALAQVNVASTNNAGLNTHLLVNSQGVSFSEAGNPARVYIGSFVGLSDSQIQDLFASNLNALAESFVSFDTDQVFGGSSTAGIFTRAFEAQIQAGNQLIGSNFFFWVTTGGPTDAAAEHLIFKFNDLVPVGSSPNLVSVGLLMNPSNGSLVIGETGVHTVTIGSNTFQTFSTVAIPEPSTVALLGLGALAGFVAFRRRR